MKATMAGCIFGLFVFLVVFGVSLLVFVMYQYAKKKNQENSKTYFESDTYYSYKAKTVSPLLNHEYRFKIIKDIITKQYKCFVLKTPEVRGAGSSDYEPHLWYNEKNEKWICWTGKIENKDQAKTLCRKWADCTQQYIDTGIPAPGFSKK